MPAPGVRDPAPGPRGAASVPVDGEASDQLRAALLSRAKAHALVGLSAISVTSQDRDAIRVALDILGQGATAQVANALETIEAAAGSSSVRSLLGLWEPAATDRRAHPNDRGALETAADDDDPLIRASAELARSELTQGGTMTKSQASMSPIEVVLALRRIPLFTALAPADLQRVAEIAKEHTRPDGDIIGAEGEFGEEMHLLLDGTVRVVRGDGETIARRGPGEVVGELSVIRRAPHVATLIAEGDVRTLHIGLSRVRGDGPRTAGHRARRHARAGRAARGDDHRTRRKSGLNVRISEPSPADIGESPAASSSSRVLPAASEAAVAEP